MVCNQKCGLMTGAIIGAILAILGGVLIPVGNNFVEKTVKKETVIEEGTIAYQNWVVSGSPVYRQFWFFDVQNPNEVLENGSKPILKQKGPYTYRMRYLAKENITQHNDSTISYFQPNIIRFEPSMSVGPENDTVTVVNLAVVSAGAMIQPGLLQTLMNVGIRLSRSKFLQTRSVKDLLWGYEDPFLKLMPVPKEVKTIGLFYPYNETLDGPFRVYNGKSSTTKTAIIQSYKNNSTLPYWDSYCSMINGTDGASFPPFVTKDRVLNFFTSDICRSFHGTFDSEQMVKGILLYRFILPPEALASPASNPDNICFCTEMKLSKNCTLGGVLDISACKKGKPVYITLPHFLYASKILLEDVDGLKPNLQEHMTFLDVEPTTGFTLHFAKRLQINLLVQPSETITVLKNVKHSFVFPILWLNETAIIDDKKAEMFRSKVTNKIKLLHLLEMVFIIAGSVMFLGFLVAFFICRGKSPK